MIPFEIVIYDNNLDKIVTKPEKVLEFNEIDPFDGIKKDFVLPITESANCCFLQSDYKCAIYNDRPQVCRIYGDESIPNLSCHWQDKNGNKRSRQSKRALERKSKKHLDSYLKKGKSIIKGENK
jgi:Fe-S-cluster containining protein